MKTNSKKLLDRTFFKYLIGFIISIALSLEAYYLALGNNLNYANLIAILLLLAVIQLIVQLVFFIHIVDEKKPRINLQVLIFASFTVLVIVFGSLWIMNNLDKYHGAKTLPKETNEYIIKDEGFSN